MSLYLYYSALLLLLQLPYSFSLVIRILHSEHDELVKHDVLMIATVGKIEIKIAPTHQTNAT